MRFVPSIALVSLFALRSATALASWSPSGTPVCTAPGYQGDLVAVPMPEAYAISSWQSMFALWSDARDTVPAGMNLYFQRIVPFDPPGAPAVGNPAVVAPGYQGSGVAAFTGVSSNHPPSNAGVIVAWSDNRNGALDVYAKRLFDSPFTTPWPADGVPVCAASGTQFNLLVVGEADAGATLAWLDGRTGFNSVYAQRLDRNGVPQWSANGIPVCDAPGYRYALKLAASPDGGAFVVWADDRPGPIRVFATRLLPDGTPAAGWPAGGLTVSGLTAAALGPVVPDGAGGIYVTFLSGGGLPVACRIDGDANVHAGWPGDGVPLAATPFTGGIEDAAAYSGGLVVLWSKNIIPPTDYFEFDLMAQRLLGDGTRAAGWGTDGNVLCDAPGNQGGARLAADAPAIVATWEDSRVGPSAPDVYALRLTDAGAPHPLWPANGALIAGGNGRQFMARPVWDGLGGVMIAYVDDHDFNSMETDVYVQRVDLTGAVGSTGVPAGASARAFDLGTPVPNPARSEVSLAIAGAGGALRAEVLDAAGRRVRDLAAAGERGLLRWDLADDGGRRVAPGLYYVRVRGTEGEAARAVIVRR